MDNWQLHVLLGIGGGVLLVLSLVLYLARKPNGVAVATAGSAVGSLLLGTGIGIFIMLQLGYGWQVPDATLFLAPPSFTPETAPGSGQGDIMNKVLIPKLKDASMEDRADVFRMKRPDEKPKPKAKTDDK